MEKLYQHLWKFRMFGDRLRLSDGTRVEILDPGTLNHGAGPDFFNSKMMIGGQHWAGNVEIHVRASDWMRHGHHTDTAYDTVILHVVGASDCRVRRTDGTEIPQVEVALPRNLYSAYSQLHADIDAVRCEAHLDRLSPLAVTDWLESLCVERLQARAAMVLRIHANCGSDWQQTCLAVLARAMGFGLNGDPFVATALSLPLRILAHHSDNSLQLEALFLGQAGLLDGSQHMFDDYYQALCREYWFMARKYGLRPLRRDLWKFSGTRPQNMPYRRLALLAGACRGGFSLLRPLMDSKGNPEQLADLFDFRLEGYWKHHRCFGDEECSAPAAMSVSSRQLLMINAAAPLYYAYGVQQGMPETAEAALDLLSALPPERNTVTRRWEAAGLKARNAAMSQALLQLRREYCDRRDCMRCRFSHQVLHHIMCEAEASPAYS